jgi:signal transduction histidine kinase
MAFNSITNIEACRAMVNIAPLHTVYYSHIPASIIALLIGFFVYSNNKRLLTGKILLAISISFSIWSLFDLTLWQFGYNSTVVTFAWSILGLAEILFFILSLYLAYAFIDKKDMPFSLKTFLVFLSLPIILLTPTIHNISGFDSSICEAMETKFIVNYKFSLEILIALWIIIFSIIRYRNAQKENKRQILLLTIGISLFLFSLSWANIFGSITLNWDISQYGLFGMPIFMGFLAYLIVRYKAFDIKLIATQALVAALIIGIGSQFFFIQNPTNIVLNGITLILVLGFGYMLVKSVKMEVQRKEELQSLSDQLAEANTKLRALDKAKSEFISIASHQLRTPLTSIKGFGSLLLEGTYGEVPEAQRGALEKIYISNERLIQLVEDLLNISRIEAGRMEFDFQEAQIEDLVSEAVTTLELSAKAKNLYLHWEKPAVAMPKLKIDITKIKEVISNMVDNAIKYTQKGGITVKLETNTVWDTEHKEHKGSVRMIVSDTGIGMDEEEIDMIFEKFQRGKQVAHFHTDGTGLGMYIAKKIVAEHKGRIWAESDGKGKGSRFILELPVQ